MQIKENANVSIVLQKILDKGIFIKLYSDITTKLYRDISNCNKVDIDIYN